MSEIENSTVIITKPQYHDFSIFRRIQEAVNAGLDIAKKDFPVGLTLDYPYCYHKKLYRLKVVVADYGNISTVNGLVPGIILQHLVVSPYACMFQLDEPDANRYSKSMVHQYLSDHSKDGFGYGLPDEFREVVAPMRLNVPYYDQSGHATDDIVDSTFFLPSLEEIGFNKYGESQSARWEYFRMYPDFYFQKAEEYSSGPYGKSSTVAGWLRSSCYDSYGYNEVWTKITEGINGRVAYVGASIAPFCAIAQTIYKPS